MRQAGVGAEGRTALRSSVGWPVAHHGTRAIVGPMNTEREPGTVLLVDADADERNRLGSWLEEDGFNVITCTGPTEPDYTCIGARAGACPLADAASVVVLDMSTESELVMEGTAAEELLGLYLFSGARVVALGSHPGEEINGELLRRHRHPGRDELLSAVHTLAGSQTPSKSPAGIDPASDAPGTEHRPL